MSNHPGTGFDTLCALASITLGLGLSTAFVFSFLSRVDHASRQQDLIRRVVLDDKSESVIGFEMRRFTGLRVFPLFLARRFRFGPTGIPGTTVCGVNAVFIDLKI